MAETKIYAYCRVSKNDGTMTIDNQISALENYAKEHNFKIDNFYRDECKGDKKVEDRQQLPVMLENLRSGDTVIVVECSRLHRNCRGLEELYRYIVEKKNCEFITIDEKEKILCTDGACDDLMQTSMKKIVLTVMGTIAEFEKRSISARTKRALEERRGRGIKLGRPSVKIPDNFKEEFLKAAKGERTHASVMKELNIKKATYYKIAKDKFNLKSNKKTVR